MTYLEKYLQEHPECDADVVIRGECPIDHFKGVEYPANCYITTTGASIRISCTACWNREMPETENAEKESDTMPTDLKNITLNSTKKTKAQLIEEINELKAEVFKLDKYKQYEEMADEMFAVKSSFVNAGFTDAEAFTLMCKMIEAACRR